MLARIASINPSAIRKCIWVPIRLATCALNFITGGSLHETFCSRVWRCWAHGSYPPRLWRGLYIVIDNLFFPFEADHCWNQYMLTTKRKIDNKWSISWLWQTF